MSYHNFKKDLCFGNKYEIKLLEYIDYDRYKQALGNFKYYDIKIYKNNEIFRYEVKADRMAYKTNNLCIEFYHTGKPSGISTTKADFWAIFVINPLNSNEETLYIIPTQIIKDMIENKEYKSQMRGRDYVNEFYLFNIKLFDLYKISK